MCQCPTLTHSGDAITARLLENTKLTLRSGAVTRSVACALLCQCLRKTMCQSSTNMLGIKLERSSTVEAVFQWEHQTTCMFHRGNLRPFPNGTNGKGSQMSEKKSLGWTHFEFEVLCLRIRIHVDPKIIRKLSIHSLFNNWNAFVAKLSSGTQRCFDSLRKELGN